MHDNISPQIIRNVLARVRHRHRMQTLCDSMIAGAFHLESCAFFFVVLRFFGWFPSVAPWTFPAAALGIGLLLGAVPGLLRPLDPKIDARCIDAQYRLKDRFATAWSLIRNGIDTPMSRLQIADAAGYASRVDPVAVRPYRLPGKTSRTLGVLTLVWFLSLIPQTVVRGTRSAIHPVPVLAADSFAAIVEDLRGDLLASLDELVRKHPEEKRLKALDSHVKRLVRKLEASPSDVKETLATLSRMETAFTGTIGAFQRDATDVSFEAIGKAFADAESTRRLARALQDGRYVQAAGELRAFQPDSLSTSERETASRNLQNAVPSIRQRRLDELAEVTENLSDALRGQDDDGAVESANTLADMARKQDMRRSVAQALEHRLAMLSLSKSDVTQAVRSASREARSGGDNTGETDRADNSRGGGAAGDPRTGRETKPDAAHEAQMLPSGLHGEGPSDIERFHGTGIDVASVPQRRVRQVDHKHRRTVESVPETEPIPVGHRRIIREYFRAIRSGEENERSDENIAP